MPISLPATLTRALAHVAERLEPIDWLVTGSVARALNGFATSPNDLDIEVRVSDMDTVAERLGAHWSLCIDGGARSHRLSATAGDTVVDASAGLVLTGPGGVLPPDFALMCDWATDHTIEGRAIRAAPLEEQIVRIMVSADEKRRQRFVGETPAGWDARESYVERRLDSARAAR